MVEVLNVTGFDDNDDGLGDWANNVGSKRPMSINFDAVKKNQSQAISFYNNEIDSPKNENFILQDMDDDDGDSCVQIEPQNKSK